MKTVLPLIVLTLITTGTTASAQIYGQAGASYLLPSDFDGDVNVDGLVGYAFGQNAIELQLGTYGFEDKVAGETVGLDMLPILINYARRFDPAGKVRYEAGAGAGVAVSKFDIPNPIGTDDVGEDAIFLGQVFGRAIYPLTGNIEAVAEYRLMISGSVDEGEEQVEGQLIHGPGLGLRFTF